MVVLVLCVCVLWSQCNQNSRDDDDRNFRYDIRARDTIIRTYGRLTIYDKTPITKFTIAVNDEKIFEIMTKYPPLHLNIKVSILLIDLEERKMLIEHEF